VIADLEHALGVRLLDRTPQGVETTAYGVALDRRVIAAFDELKQGIKDIEFLSAPTVGDVRIGCPESISAAILQPICEAFVQQYPRVVLDVDTVNTLSFAQKLRNRSLDVVLARGGWPLEDAQLVTDFNLETLYDDERNCCRESEPVGGAAQGQYFRVTRRTLDPDQRRPMELSSHCDRFPDARGVEIPKVSIKTISVHLRANMVATGKFITTFPRSVVDLYADRFGLKVLPVDLPNSNWPVKIATLRNRTLSSVVERFIACAQDTARSATGMRRAHKSPLAK
jgi:DNA-binding transcriptional LysR family regulator